MDNSCWLIPIGMGSCNIANLVPVIESPNFVGQIKVDALVSVSRLWPASRSICNSWEFSLQARPCVDNFIVFSDGNVTPVWNLHNFLNLSKLDLWNIINPKHSMSSIAKSRDIRFAKYNFSHTFLFCILVKLSKWGINYITLANL